jgi:hypothetical protein
MIECQKCHARATLFLCPLCTTELRRQLLRLPTMLDYLHDTAIGDTKMGEGGRHSGVRSETLHYNPKASALLVEIESTIGRWARAMARKYGLVPMPPVNWHRPISEYRYTTKDFALFLASHADLLAKDPDIGKLVADLRQYVKRSVNLVNRAIPPQFCGPCPTTITDHRKCVDADGAPTCRKRSHVCATRLMARRGAVEVRCPTCGVTHRVEKLVNHLLASADDYRCAIPEMYRVLRMLGEPVKLRTLYHWANPKVGKLRPAGYLRPDNRRIGSSKWSYDDRDVKDIPVYRVSDARRARNNSVQPGRRGRPMKTEGSQQK